MFDRALQNRNLPSDQWPTDVNIKLINTAEDFYNLDTTYENDIQDNNYHGDQPEFGLSAATAAALAESLEERPSVKLNSVKCNNCDCERKETKTVTNRRVCVSSHHPMADESEQASETRPDTVQPVGPSNYWPLNPGARPFQPKTILTEPGPAGESPDISSESLAALEELMNGDIRAELSPETQTTADQWRAKPTTNETEPANEAVTADARTAIEIYNPQPATRKAEYPSIQLKSIKCSYAKQDTSKVVSNGHNIKNIANRRIHVKD